MSNFSLIDALALGALIGLYNAAVYVLFIRGSKKRRTLIIIERGDHASHTH